MDILSKIPPHALWLLVFMVGFGVYWKKSMWPNRYFPIVNLILPILLYPLLELSISDEPYHEYRQPVVVLCLAGAAVAVATAFLHNAIVNFLKKKFPSLDFPDDAYDPATDTQPEKQKQQKPKDDPQ